MQYIAAVGRSLRNHAHVKAPHPLVIIIVVIDVVRLCPTYAICVPLMIDRGAVVSLYSRDLIVVAAAAAAGRDERYVRWIICFLRCSSIYFLYSTCVSPREKIVRWIS